MELPIEWLPAAGAPEQLIVLLHGWCSSGSSMAPLAQALRAQFPQAAVLAPDGPQPADPPRSGCQWYSVQDPADPLTEANWPQRVAPLLPSLQQWVQAQQQRLGVGPAATCLGGFSQGAILSLALASLQDGLCGRVLAFGGRYVEMPLLAPRQTTIHFFHGGADRVIPAQAARDALEHLGALQGDATLDVAAEVGHELHPALIACALQRLQTHIPLRTWQAAMGAVPGH